MQNEKKESHKSQHYSLSGVEFNGGEDLFFKNDKREDHLIENEILEILLNLKHIEIKHKYLEVRDGVVKLSGEIESYHDWKKIHDSILQVQGVLDLIDHLQIK